MKQPKILILSMTAGAGHHSAAQSLQKVFAQYHSQVEVYDIFSSKPSIQKMENESLYWAMDNIPQIYDFFWNMLKKRDPEKRYSGGIQNTIQKVEKDILKKIETFNPDAIVCTHFYASAIVCNLKRKHLLRHNLFTSAILTDLLPHPFWETSILLDTVYTMSNHAKKDLIQKGFTADQMKALGFPIKQEFNRQTTKLEARHNLQLPTTMPVVLVMSGGASGKLLQLVKTLCKKHLAVHIVAINGSNKKSYNQIEKYIQTNQITNVTNLGFVNNVYDYMHAADVYITKAGGGSISEAMACGLPMILRENAVTNEKENSDILCDIGVALSMDSIKDAPKLTTFVLQNENLRNFMSKAARAFAKPNAAEDIAIDVLRQIKQHAQTPKRLKIGLFLDTFFPMIDGVITVVHNYASLLSQIADVTVFTTSTTKASYDDKQYPYKVVRCKVMKASFMDYDIPMPSQDRAFKKALQKAQLDIVHIHSPFGVGKVGAAYAKKCKIPLIATFHSQYKKDIDKVTNNASITKMVLSVLMSVFNQADVCFTMNSFCANILRQYGYKGKIDIVPNASSLVPTKTKETYAQQANQLLKVKATETVFSFVGRLISTKNIFMIMQALEILKQKGLPFTFVFAGSGIDEEKLKQDCKKKHLENHVIFTGTVQGEDLLSIYARSLLFVFPSDYDTDGIVKIEAASVSTPSVCLKNSGAGAAITDHVNGMLIDNNAQSLAQVLEYAIKNPKEMHLLGTNANKTLFTTWENIVQDVFNKYVTYINYQKKCNVEKFLYKKRKQKKQS